MEEIKAIVAVFAAQYGADRVYLFGSYARGDADANSDIDLRIDKGSIRGLQMGGLAADLEDAFGIPVDLVPTGIWTVNLMTRCCSMKPLDRNISILEHMIGYCAQIEETIRRCKE